MLYMIGLGLDDGEITRKGIEALEDAEEAFAEFYTNTETVDLSLLEEEAGTEIEKLERDKVEREDRIIEAARKKDTAFLVSGDPLTATTHYDIKHRAEKEGIEVEVVHAPSIMTSIAETGLNIYKFGRTVTLPKESKPESIIEYMEKNDEVGLHTLVLLDINYDASKAAEKLVDMDEELKERRAIVFSRANTRAQEVKIGELGELAEKEYGEPPHSIVLVGETDHKEEEFLSER